MNDWQPFLPHMNYEGDAVWLYEMATATPPSPPRFMPRIATRCWGMWRFVDGMVVDATIPYWCSRLVIPLLPGPDGKMAPVHVSDPAALIYMRLAHMISRAVEKNDEDRFQALLDLQNAIESEFPEAIAKERAFYA